MLLTDISPIWCIKESAWVVSNLRGWAETVIMPRFSINMDTAREVSNMASSLAPRKGLKATLSTIMPMRAAKSMAPSKPAHRGKCEATIINTAQ
jgi:hypothetical protein